MTILKFNRNMMLCLTIIAGFTWLNPHVWLDMVMIVGASAQTINSDIRIYFLGGVVLSSTVWFISIGYGARYMRPLFQNPSAWRIIDGVTAVALLGIAINLLLKLLSQY